MRILLDQPALALLVPMQLRQSLENHPLCRCYAAGAPLQTTLELWNGLALDTLVNRVVEAECTYGFGEPGSVLPGYEGRLHRYIQVFEPIDAQSDIDLWQLMLTGPRAETDAAAIPTTGPRIDLARWTARRQVDHRL
jgi:hypothetical protein